MQRDETWKKSERKISVKVTRASRFRELFLFKKEEGWIGFGET